SGRHRPATPRLPLRWASIIERGATGSGKCDTEIAPRSHASADRLGRSQELAYGLRSPAPLVVFPLAPLLDLELQRHRLREPAVGVTRRDDRDVAARLQPGGAKSERVRALGADQAA